MKAKASKVSPLAGTLKGVVGGNHGAPGSGLDGPKLSGNGQHSAGLVCPGLRLDDDRKVACFMLVNFNQIHFRC